MNNQAIAIPEQETVQDVGNNTDESVMSLSDFIGQFNQGLVEAVSQKNPPLYDGKPDLVREKVMDGLLRHPFPSQRGRVQAITRLLVDEGDKACILNAEMGTGKTMMAISASAVMQAEGYQRFLIIVPPHLCYKWRREILETVPDAKVWVLNGPDTLMKLLKLRESLGARQYPGCSLSTLSWAVFACGWVFIGVL